MNLRDLLRTSLLYRYILRAHIGPFLFSLSTLMFLFLLQFVMKFIDQLVGKGLSAWVIMELVALNLSWMLVLAFPMSVLVAVLMAFGELSGRNEVTVMRASGVSIYRMMAPVLVAAALVAIFLVWFNNYVLPESNHALKTLTVDIRRKKPTLTLVNGVFSQDIQGYSILVRRTFEKSNELEGVTLYDYSDPAQNVVVTAERGAISFSPDYRRLILDLTDGEIHQLDLAQITSYRKIRFSSHRILMNVEGFEFERSSESAFSRSDRELGAGAMRHIVDSLRSARAAIEKDVRSTMSVTTASLLGTSPESSLPPPPPHVSRATPLTLAITRAQETRGMVATAAFKINELARQTNQYLVEIHKKYSIPFACLVFVLVGAPLGIMSRRGGFGVAATLSLGFFILYWAFLIGGEKLADRTILSPWLGMWAANILIGLLGIYLTVRVGRETLLINWSALRRFVPRRWREEAPDTSEQGTS